MAVTTPDVAAEAAADASRFTRADEALAARMPNMVKGAGYIRGHRSTGGYGPVEDYSEVFERSTAATAAIKKAVHEGRTSPESVVKSFSPEFMAGFGGFMQQQNPGMAAFMSQMQDFASQVSAELGKNFTLTSPLSTGLVPYNLLAPSI